MVMKLKQKKDVDIIFNVNCPHLKKHCKEQNECMNCIYRKGKLCAISDLLDMYLAYQEKQNESRMD